MFRSICPLQAISRTLFIPIVVAPFEFRRTVRHLALFVPPPHQQPLRIRNHDGGAGLRNCTPPPLHPHRRPCLGQLMRKSSGVFLPGWGMLTILNDVQVGERVQLLQL